MEMIPTQFGVHDDRRGRRLTAKEIEDEMLYMNCHGQLVRIEVWPGRDSVLRAVERTANDLYIVLP